jgi:RNA recognition motif-containing protein
LHNLYHFITKISLFVLQAFAFFSELNADKPEIAAAVAAAGGVKAKEWADGDDGSEAEAESGSLNSDEDSDEGSDNDEDESEDDAALAAKEKETRRPTKALEKDKSEAGKAKPVNDLAEVLEVKPSKKAKKAAEIAAAGKAAQESDSESDNSDDSSQDDDDDDDDDDEKSDSTSSSSDSENDGEINEDSLASKTTKTAKQAPLVQSSKAKHVTPTEYPPGKGPPDGYVCKACSTSGHWIYDCATYVAAKAAASAARVAAQQGSKKTKPVTGETSEISSGSVGKSATKEKTNAAEITEQGEDPCKVFVQGLPFDMTQVKLKKLVEDKTSQTVKTVKLICFEEAAPKAAAASTAAGSASSSKAKPRCKGMAYVAFHTPEAAQLAIATLHKHQLGARWLSVSLAQVKQEGGNKRSASGKDKGSGSNGSSGSSGGGVACFRCGKRGHTPQACAQKRVCYRCQSTDHLSSNCPKKKKA